MYDVFAHGTNVLMDATLALAGPWRTRSAGQADGLCEGQQTLAPAAAAAAVYCRARGVRLSVQVGGHARAAC